MASQATPVNSTSPVKTAGGAAQPGSQGNAPAAQPQPTASRDFTKATLCRMGQESVQDIVHKTNELFVNLKTLQLPSNDQASAQFAERKAKVEEQTKHIVTKFRYLHLIYDRINDMSADLDMVDVDHMAIVTSERYKEAPKYTSDEQRHLIEQLHVKNAQLKEIMDKLRTIVWEINTMMAMKKSVTS